MTPDDEVPEHRRLQAEAIAADGDAQRALLAGDAAGARAAFRRAVELYRASWDIAPPASYGRLVGAAKAAILAGDVPALGVELDVTSSPVAAWAAALEALGRGDDNAAHAAGTAMLGAPEPFARTGRAVVALADGDGGGYAEAVAEIVTDFEARDDHLTGVAIADTALVLERLAARRGMRAGVASPLLPPAAP